MNSHRCPYGFNTHPRKGCACSPTTVSRYQKRISGPLLDRIDVFVEVPPVEYERLVDEGPAEASSGAPRRPSQRQIAACRSGVAAFNGLPYSYWGSSQLLAFSYQLFNPTASTPVGPAPMQAC